MMRRTTLALIVRSLSTRYDPNVKLMKSEEFENKDLQLVGGSVARSVGRSVSFTVPIQHSLSGF